MAFHFYRQSAAPSKQQRPNRSDMTSDRGLCAQKIACGALETLLLCGCLRARRAGATLSVHICKICTGTFNARVAEWSSKEPRMSMKAGSSGFEPRSGMHSILGVSPLSVGTLVPMTVEPAGFAHMNSVTLGAEGQREQGNHVLS